MVKKLVRLVVILGAVGTGFWLVRDRMFPPPTLAPEPAPMRGPTPAAPRATTADDLTEINGIGPVYSARLADRGVATFVDLADVDAASMAAALGVREAVVAEWARQARSRSA